MDEVANIRDQFVVYSMLEVLPVKVYVDLAEWRYRRQIISQVVRRKLIEELSYAYIPSSAFGEFLSFEEQMSSSWYVVWKSVFSQAKSHSRQKQIVVIYDVFSDKMVDFRGVPSFFAIGSSI